MRGVFVPEMALSRHNGVPFLPKPQAAFLTTAFFVMRMFIVSTKTENAIAK
jgi:hypothetical protein